MVPKGVGVGGWGVNGATFPHLKMFFLNQVTKLCKTCRFHTNNFVL